MTAGSRHCPLSDHTITSPRLRLAAAVGNVQLLLCVLIVASRLLLLVSAQQDQCDSSPCQNGATCKSTSDTDYCCLCTRGFSGINCADVDDAATRCGVCTDASLQQRAGCLCNGIPMEGATTCQCFPRSATVTVVVDPTATGDPIGPSSPSLTQKTMDQLKIGDKVLSMDPIEYKVKAEHIVMFSHGSKHHINHNYRRIQTDSGQHITASNGHQIWRVDTKQQQCGAAGGLVAAERVEPGDVVMVASSNTDITSSISPPFTPSQVVNVTTVTDTGAYNPHTHGGSIIANGVLASCYTEVAIGSARATHALLWPVRLAFHLTPNTHRHVYTDYLHPAITRVIEYGRNRLTM